MAVSPILPTFCCDLNRDFKQLQELVVPPECFEEPAITGAQPLLGSSSFAEMGLTKAMAQPNPPWERAASSVLIAYL